MGGGERKKTVVLGPEYDEELREALLQTLAKMGCLPLQRSYGVGGSQEVEVAEFAVGEETLKVESETYVGLTLTGKQELVDSIAAELAGRRRT